jgi:hypothetical protein
MERLLTAEWWVLVVVIAMSASGLIQWLKGFLKRAPSWAWGLLLPVLCLALAVAWQPWPWLLAAALLGLVLAQIGYDTLLRGLLAWVARLQGPQLQIPVPPPPAPPPA